MFIVEKKKKKNGAQIIIFHSNEVECVHYRYRPHSLLWTVPVAFLFRRKISISHLNLNRKHTAIKRRRQSIHRHSHHIKKNVYSGTRPVSKHSLQTWLLQQQKSMVMDSTDCITRLTHFCGSIWIMSLHFLFIWRNNSFFFKKDESSDRKFLHLKFGKFLFNLSVFNSCDSFNLIKSIYRIVHLECIDFIWQFHRSNVDCIRHLASTKKYDKILSTKKESI